MKHVYITNSDVSNKVKEFNKWESNQLWLDDRKLYLPASLLFDGIDFLSDYPPFWEDSSFPLEWPLPDDASFYSLEEHYSSFDESSFELDYWGGLTTIARPIGIGAICFACSWAISLLTNLMRASSAGELMRALLWWRWLLLIWGWIWGWTITVGGMALDNLSL